MIILSDHGFDWSLRTNFVNLEPSLPANVFPVENGGADNLYLVDPDDPLFGLEPRGYDGRVRAEAFTITASPSRCGGFPATD